MTDNYPDDNPAQFPAEEAEELHSEETSGETPEGADEQAEESGTEGPAINHAAYEAPAFQTQDRAQQLRLLEAILFAASEPLTREAIALRMPFLGKKDGGEVLDSLVEELEQVYAGRGINLMRVAGKFTLRTAPDLVDALKIERQVGRKLSRAAIETMSIIAYHQPITRAEVEEIRGVALSRGTLDLLMEAGWIQPKGHRETPGRPATWVTTEQFLMHFGLDHLQDLPGVEDLKAAGLLDARPAVSAYSEEAGLTFPDQPGEAEQDAEDAETAEAAADEAPTDKPSAG